MPEGKLSKSDFCAGVWFYTHTKDGKSRYQAILRTNMIPPFEIAGGDSKKTPAESDRKKASA